MGYVEELLENLSDKMTSFQRQHSDAADMTMDKIQQNFTQSHESAARMTDMLNKISQQMQIQNALAAISLEQQFEAQGKELPAEYKKLTQKAIAEALPTKNLEGRGNEFDGQFSSGEAVTPDFILE